MYKKKMIHTVLSFVLLIVLSVPLSITANASSNPPSDVFFGIPIQVDPDEFSNYHRNDLVYVFTMGQLENSEWNGIVHRVIDSNGNYVIESLSDISQAIESIDCMPLPLVAEGLYESGEYTIEVAYIKIGYNEELGDYDWHNIIEEAVSPIKLKLNVIVETEPFEISGIEYNLNKDEYGDYYSGEAILRGNFDSNASYFVSYYDEHNNHLDGQLGDVLDSHTLRTDIYSDTEAISIATVQRFSNISFTRTSASVTMTPIAEHTHAVSTPTKSESTPISPESAPTPTPAYIYDASDPGGIMVLPSDKLESVTDKSTAISAIQSAVSDMTATQKQSATGIDLIALYSEEAISQAASNTISGGDIVIDQSNVQDMQAAARDIKAAAEQALSAAGITTARELNANIKLKTNETNSIKITVDPSAVNTTADNIRVETPDYAISFSAESIKENAGRDSLVITITEGASTASAPIIHDSMAMVSTERVIPITNMDIVAGTSTAASTKTYNISFNKPVTENIKVSFPPASGDPTYQAITNSAGTAVGGKHNPVTGNLEAKINKGDTYTVKENRKDFSDISNKSKEMQEAIRILASKGIISGTTATQFSPDGTITRAEIAALIVRTLSKLDPNADGGFIDVKKSDWFFGSVGSAKRYGIISGMTETTFAPRTNIKKDQIVAITARTLRKEMKYKNPTDIEKVLSTYSDRGDIPSWGTTDIALATRENLVVKRMDSKFGASSTMTRGDAAIILYRMFNKIW